MDKIKIFISYARDTDEKFVKGLYHDLEKKCPKINVWWDREKMESRGKSFLQEIRDAIADSDHVIAIISPKAISSPYVQYEWEYALLFAKNLIPVLRDGDFPLVPQNIFPEDDRGLAITNLATRDCLDFRDKKTVYKDQLDKLIRVLQSPIESLASRDGTPGLPPHFLPRRDDIVRLRDIILADLQRPEVITPDKQIMALQGMGGIGKSVLAAAFALSINTRRAFSKGNIFWLKAGQDATRGKAEKNVKNIISTLLIDQKEKIENQWSEEKISEVKKQVPLDILPDLLEMIPCLIIVDDVWSIDQVEIFQSALSLHCRLLITTRDEELAKGLGGQVYCINKLSDEQSLNLLIKCSKLEWGTLSDDALVVAELCRGLPLALAMCGGMMVGRKRPWSRLRKALETGESSIIKGQLPNYPYHSVFSALEISVGFIEHDNPVAAHCYRELTVFPRSVAVPEQAVLKLWCAMQKISEIAAEELVDVLAEKALLSVDGSEPNRRVSIHDLQYDYLYSVTAGEISTLHNKLIDSYRPGTGSGWDSVTNDGYILQNLTYHLAGAGLMNELKQLLLNIHWLRRKRELIGYHDTIADYDKFKEMENARNVADAIEKYTTGSKRNKVQVLGILGRIYEALGRRKKEEQTLIVARELAEDLGDDLLRASILTQSGIFLFHSSEKGAKKQSRKDLSVARKIFKKNRDNLVEKDKSSYAHCLDWSGVHQRDLSKFKASSRLHNKSAEIAREIGDSRLEAHAIANIGAIYYWKRDYKKALHQWQQSLDISERARDFPWIVHYMIDVGYMSFLVLRFAGEDDEEALKTLERGIELAEKGHFHDEHARGLMNKASVLFSRNRLKDAEKFYLKALEISEHEQIARLSWRIRHNLGNTFRMRWYQGHEQDDLDQADKWYLRARKDLESLASEYSSRQRSEFLKHRLNLYRTLILNYLSTGRIKEAHDCAAIDELLVKYLDNRELKLNLAQEEKNQKNYNFFDLNGFQCYIETE